MAYTPPTAADVKARFPEFVPVSDALINLLLEEAIPQVGETWVERDRKPATLYLVAHMLAMEGEPGRTNTGNGIGSSGPMRRRKVGDTEVEFAAYGGNLRGGTTATGFAATSYGQQYLRLMRLNFPAIGVV